MGGDDFFPPLPSTDDGSSKSQDLSSKTIDSVVSSSDDDEGSSRSSENSPVGDSETESRLSSGESVQSVEERQRSKVHAEVLRRYRESGSRVDERLENAKNKIASYKPGSWTEKKGKYYVPDKTSLLLIGPKGSGKSSLVNKISRVLEENDFLSERAQVSSGDGTYFVREYRVPRGSGSISVYDSRGLSVDESENWKMFRRWITKGVRHGELVKRKSDSKELKARLNCNARRSCPSSQFTAVNFVIFVVNGLSVLESMDSIEEKKKEYCQVIAANFKNPILSFKDDRPVVVVTHGDLLSLSDRVRVCVYVGKLLGVPPTSQIFDIPENNDSATRLAILDMLTYSLEHADWNLPPKRKLSVGKVYFVACLLSWIVLATAVFWRIFDFLTLSPQCSKISQPFAPPPEKGAPPETKEEEEEEEAHRSASTSASTSSERSSC